MGQDRARRTDSWIAQELLVIGGLGGLRWAKRQGGAVEIAGLGEGRAAERGGGVVVGIDVLVVVIKIRLLCLAPHPGVDASCLGRGGGRCCGPGGGVGEEAAGPAL